MSIPSSAHVLAIRLNTAVTGRVGGSLTAEQFDWSVEQRCRGEVHPAASGGE